MTRNMTSEISYSEFIEMLENGEVESVVLRSDTLTITPKTQRSMAGTTEIYTTLMEDESELTQRLEAAGVDNFSKEPPDMTSSIIYSLLSIILPVIIMVGLLSWLFRRMNKGGGMMGGVGKSKAKAYVQKETGVTFKDVAGEDEAKESLQEVVDFLHNPGKYAAIGAKLPKGALLVGQKRYLDQFHLFFSDKLYLELVTAGVSKGAAVETLCQLLSIPIANSIAVGDAENDISMIQAAHTGAVMANASDRIKQFGNYITEADNNHSGVAEVIRKFLLS